MKRKVRRMSDDYPLSDEVVAPRQLEFSPPVGRKGFRLGDEGPGVAALQMRLGCPATGVYDTTTEFAVLRFQKSVNLTVDGVAGKAVHGRLGLSWDCEG